MKLIFLCFFFLSSCALFQSKKALEKLSAEDFFKESSKVCLTGQGRSRLEFGGEQATFSYDFITRSNSWVAGISIPFRGEEALRVIQVSEGTRYEGDFYRRTQRGYKNFLLENPDYPATGLKEVLRFMMRGRLFFKSNKNNLKRLCAKEPSFQCSYPHKSMRFTLDSNQFQIEQELKGFHLKWVMEGGEEFFQKETIELEKGGEKLISLLFFHSRCQFDSTES